MATAGDPVHQHIRLEDSDIFGAVQANVLSRDPGTIASAEHAAYIITFAFRDAMTEAGISDEQADEVWRAFARWLGRSRPALLPLPSRSTPMPGDEPEAAPRRGTVMQIAISAEARVIKAEDTRTEQEEPEDG